MYGFGKRFRSLANSFASFKPHARPLAVPIDEDHTGRFEGTAQIKKCPRPRKSSVSFKVSDCLLRNLASFFESVL